MCGPALVVYHEGHEDLEDHESRPRRSRRSATKLTTITKERRTPRIAGVVENRGASEARLPRRYTKTRRVGWVAGRWPATRSSGAPGTQALQAIDQVLASPGAPLDRIRAKRGPTPPAASVSFVIVVALVRRGFVVRSFQARSNELQDFCIIPTRKESSCSLASPSFLSWLRSR
jgi:hypothetical protein